MLFLKMLRPSSVRPVYRGKPYPTWDLMMKNIYAINGFNIQPDNFQLDIVYESTDGTGDINFLPRSAVKNTPLIQVFAVDRLTNNSEAGPDNRFDFLTDRTIVPDKGLIIFPKLEPFGSWLVKQFALDPSTKDEDSARYAYPMLYSMTQVDATQNFPQLNRFKFKGTYQSSTSSEISLNSVQVAQGSVRVTAGGIPLVEGQDYSVDYQIGKVTILNPGILNSGQEIKVKFETNTLFGIDQKTMVGARFDYRLNKDIQLGGTILHLNERPLINKINLGDEPISNTIWGVDVNLKKDSRLITKIIDKLPFYSTKEVSNLQLQGEFAHFIPGHPRQISTGNEKGISYLDDFEGTKSIVDLTGVQFWKLASLPVNVPEPQDTSLKASGFTRAKLAWYQIDPIFYTNREDFGFDAQSPSLNNHYSRRVEPKEVFPNVTVGAGNNVLATFDLHYFPTIRGPYNYEYRSSRLNPNGTFRFPKENWAGIMRRTTGNTDFEAANFEF
ncbi:MAG: cell surface protein SprA, partial [Bacteroidia bacterium]|nr:cell surface protein SprA [Bacteroidia bacterium]